MDIFYNNKPFQVSLVFKQGETIDMTFTVYDWNPITLAWDLFDMTGMIIKIQFRRKDGLLIKELFSNISPPGIIILTSNFTINDVGFNNPDFLDYDVKITSGTNIKIFMEGYAWIKKLITL